LRIHVLALAALTITTSCGDAGCANSDLQDLVSPDGRRHVVVFGRACGATTGFSTQVSILTRARTATGGGNVFSADTDHGRVPAGRGGGPAVLVEWADARTVKIHYMRGARVFKQDTRHDDTDVQYVVEADLGSRP
jgi:hypothetical protein